MTDLTPMPVSDPNLACAADGTVFRDPARPQPKRDVRRALRAASPDTKLVASPKDAQAILQEVSNTRALREVSLNAQGRVEEYELGINYTFRMKVPTYNDELRPWWGKVFAGLQYVAGGRGPLAKSRLCWACWYSCSASASLLASRSHSSARGGQMVGSGPISLHRSS